MVCWGGGGFTPVAYADPDSVEIVPGTTYYVSASGDDTNSGTSEEEPFKTLDKVNTLTLHAGDKILLKRGDTFNNQHLCISGDKDFAFNDGSGCAFQADVDGAPLIISAYGEGSAKPVIAANGTGKWKLDYGLTLAHTQHYLARDDVSSTLMLKDAENIEISDLEITNTRVEDAEGKENGCLYNDNCALDRTGIAGVAQNKGTLDHVVLKNLYVHDVQGNVYNKHSMNGAIYFTAFIASDKMASEADRRTAGFVPSLEEPASGYPRFNDLHIVDNRVEDSGRWGIAAVYSAYGSAALDSKVEIPDADITKYGATNVVISRNFIKNIGGDAITTMYGYKPVVESNVATEIATQMNTSDYLFAADGNPGKFDKTGGRVAASIWPWKSKNAVFRFNEGFNTRGADRGNGNGMPWDADSGDGTLYEYNYSANNTGGTVMFCGDQAANSTFRFNIAQNDKLGALSPTFWSNNNYHNKYPDAHVYNNTFYMKDGASVLHPGQGQQGNMKVENNIFYWDEATPRTETWTVNGMTWDANVPDGTLQVTYSNNLYYNFANYPASDTKAVKIAKDEADVLVNPGSGPTDAAANMQARNHYFKGLSYADADAKETEFDSYKLSADSPAIGKGKAITDDNGFVIDTDFFGRPANTYDIGAVSTDNGVPEPVKKAAALLDTVYQVTTTTANANGVTTGKNSEYTAGNVIHVPSTTKSPSTVGVVLANVNVDGTAVIVDANGSELSADTQIASGMKLKITGEDESVIEFPIEIDNTYNWRDDYTYDVQGNVWFAQKQNGADGNWENIASSDPAWPNWAYDEYYGAGINGDNKAPTDRSTLHGLLMDSPVSAGATAMAWRAPKSGYIKFETLKGVNGAPNEPYLRQGNATGGTVTVKLIVNGEEKRALTLETMNVRPNGDFDYTARGQWALHVNHGDYVRVVTEATGNPADPSMFVTPIITYIDRIVTTDEIVPVTPESEGITASGSESSSDNTESGDPAEPGNTAPTGPIYVEGKVPGFALELAGDGVVGKVSLPEVEGVDYLVNDAPLNANYGPGAVIVKAVAKDGYKLGERATTEWKFVVPATPEFDSESGQLTVAESEGAQYDATSQTVNPGDTVVVTSTAADGYSMAATRAVKWTFTASGEPAEEAVVVSPQAPQAVNPSALDPANCATKPYVVLSPVEGVTYIVKLGDTELTPNTEGRYEYEYGQKVTVTASAQDGYVLAQDAEHSWEFSAQRAEKCAPGTVIDIPDISTDDDNLPSNDSHESLRKDASSVEVLSRTGATVVTMMVMALLLGLSGATLAVLRRTK